MRSAPSLRATTPALILLVDDNPHGILARKSVLEELGYQIISASSAEDALLLVKEHRVDLVVTDFKMREMDGVGFIAALRSGGLNVPVILLSGFADKLGFNERSTGASLVIQKSGNEVDPLLRGIKRLLTPAKKPPSAQLLTGVAKRKAKAGD
jgi:CheY-like chemotaxis protein